MFRDLVRFVTLFLENDFLRGYDKHSEGPHSFLAHVWMCIFRMLQKLEQFHGSFSLLRSHRNGTRIMTTSIERSWRPRFHTTDNPPSGHHQVGKTQIPGPQNVILSIWYKYTEYRPSKTAAKHFINTSEAFLAWWNHFPVIVTHCLRRNITEFSCISPTGKKVVTPGRGSFKIMNSISNRITPTSHAQNVS